MPERLTHLDPLGRARMVDVTPKEPSHRRAVARCKVYMRPETTAAIANREVNTGAMLAVARAMGETAPLLLTALNFDSINANPFKGQQAGLPSFVFAQAGQFQQAAVDRAWAGALTLLLLVLLLNLVARMIARRTRLKG